MAHSDTLSPMSNGAGGGFNPASDPTLIAWLDPTSLTTMSSDKRVISVVNRGSLGGVWLPGTDAQVPGQGLGPIWSQSGMNGRSPSFSFSSADKTSLKIYTDAMSGPGVVPLTIICGVSPSSNVISAVIACVATTSDANNPGTDVYSVADVGTVTFECDYGGEDENYVSAAGTPLAPIIPHVVTSIVDSSFITLRVDGTVVDQNAGPEDSAFPVDEIVVGCDGDIDTTFTTGLYLDGVVSHVMIFKRALSSDECRRIEDWIASSY